MEVEFHPQPRTWACSEQKATASDTHPKGILYFASLHLFGGLSHQLAAPELNQKVTGPEAICNVLFHAFSDKTPKGSTPGAVVGKARDKQEC